MRVHKSSSRNRRRLISRERHGMNINLISIYYISDFISIPRDVGDIYGENSFYGPNVERKFHFNSNCKSMIVSLCYTCET